MATSFKLPSDFIYVVFFSREVEIQLERDKDNKNRGMVLLFDWLFT